MGSTIHRLPFTVCRFAVLPFTVAVCRLPLHRLPAFGSSSRKFKSIASQSDNAEH
jgi:hypothetical protein